jgi:hypothetical protein
MSDCAISVKPLVHKVFASIACLVSMSVVDAQRAGHRPSKKESLDSLGTARYRMDSIAIEELAGEKDLIEHIYTMPLDQHVFGYYPFGVSNRRFLTSIVNGEHGVTYQVLIGKKVQKLWTWEVRHTHRAPKFKGTFALMLRQEGFEIWGSVSPSAAKILNEVTPLAGYGFAGQVDDEFFAWTVRVDGTKGPIYSIDMPRKDFDRMYPITPEESTALKKGSRWWPIVVKGTEVSANGFP